MKILALFFCTFCFFLQLRGQESTLRKLQVIFRHGARAQDKQVWGRLDSCFPKMDLGDLTPFGRSQMKYLGFHLRIAYNHFIGAGPDKTEVIYSNYTRNIDTAHLVFNDALFSEYNVSRKDFTVIGPDVDGPMAIDYDYFYDTFQKLLPVSDYQSLMDEITNTGETLFPITKLEHLYQIEDQIECQLANDCPLPSWLTEPLRENLSGFIHAYFHAFTNCSHDQMVKENSDLMVQELLAHFNSTDCNRSFNTYLYSSHDTNIALLLSRLSIFNGLPVPFASAVVFELHRIQDTDVVRIFYHNSTTYGSPHRLQVPGCDLDCPLDTFARIVTQPYLCT